MATQNIHQKSREIQLRGPTEPSLNADGAIFLLADNEGIRNAIKLNDLRFSVSYDLTIVSLEQIELALAEVGFHLDNSLINKIKRAIDYFTEDNQRRNHGLSKLTCSEGCSIKVFAARYRQLSHGCRDPRPEHLRRYL